MNGKWIWCKNSLAATDDYAQFKASFRKEGTQPVLFSVSCDGFYSASVNGKLIGFYGCSDYPDYKFYDTYDISELCGEENELLIDVWHMGIDTQTYIAADAGLLFEVTQDGRTLVASGPETLSRPMNEYRNGYEKQITCQLGLSFCYDNTAVKSSFSESVPVTKTAELHKRPIQPMYLEKRPEIRIIQRENSMLIDWGRELAGYVDLEFTSPVSQKLTIAYGEHIVDGGVRREVGERDFSVEFIARKGENRYLNLFRRIAGRYMEVFCDMPVEIGYIGIRPVFYPVKLQKRTFADPLMQRIYDVSVDTLRMCMHEHYEDCPWREQALYTLDSRNQMLCGYLAFEGTDYQRANLSLIGKGLRPDGLLTICYPSGRDVPIPFFSLMYFLEVYEYVQKTGDRSLLDEIGPTLRTLAETFRSRIDATGLIASFPDPFWNFYEWTPSSMGVTKFGPEPVYELILNCAYVYVMPLYDELMGRKGDYGAMKEAIHRTFFDSERGVYRLGTVFEESSQLGNAFALLIGLGDQKLARKIMEDPDLTPATLSMRAFLYDALLAADGKNGDFVLRDIKERYKKMLDAGATTFWETEKGEADFDNAGSLCHGWSAIPIYYFHRLGQETAG